MDGDVDAIDPEVVCSRAELVQYLRQLSLEVEEPQAFQNSSVEPFVEAWFAYCVDLPDRYVRADAETLEPGWMAIAVALAGACIYD